jgi:hypothetical protein
VEVAGTNALAYSTVELITTVKGFTAQAPVNFSKALTLSYSLSNLEALINNIIHSTCDKFKRTFCLIRSSLYPSMSRTEFTREVA